MSETPTYTFSLTPNSYFLGNDLRVTDDKSGRSISLNVKEGMWAIDVKDRNVYRDMSTEAQKAADAIGEDRVQTLYGRALDDFWNGATATAHEHGFSDVLSAGRSGGWMAVEDTENYDLRELIEPAEALGEGDTEDVATVAVLGKRFLAFAFAVTDTIDKLYRPEFEAVLIEEAAKPETTQIMVLPDGETFAGLDDCTIFEVPADLEIEEIEQLLEDESCQPTHRFVDGKLEVAR